MIPEMTHTVNTQPKTEYPPLEPSRPYRRDDGQIAVPVGLLELAYRLRVREILYFDPEQRQTLSASVPQIWLVGEADTRQLVTTDDIWKVVR